MFVANSKKSRKPAAASQPMFLEPLEERRLCSVTAVGHALPARGVSATIPAVQMSAHPTSHGSSLGTALHPAVGQQRLVVIAIIGVLISLLQSPTRF